MEEESFAEALRNYLLIQINSLQRWIQPDPADHMLIQALKLIYKSIAILLLLALSPVVILFLIVSFAGGF